MALGLGQNILTFRHFVQNHYGFLSFLPFYFLFIAEVYNSIFCNSFYTAYSILCVDETFTYIIATD